MPELPEVETFRRYFDRTSLNKKIEGIELRAGKMLKGISSRSLQVQLKNNKFKKTSRHAKYLFAHTDNEKILVLHFGMTGFLHYFKDKSEKPGHTRMLIDFNNGYHLAFDCQRKFGKIHLIDNKEKFIEEKKLGPDPIADEMNLLIFRKLLEGKKGSIKSTLMDQKTIGGIGNIYTDEILFNAGIHPSSKTEKLKDDQIKKLFHMMIKILRKAIDVNADSDRMPSTYLLHNRKSGADCPMCTSKIRKQTISGRTSYYCGKHQKMIK